MYNCGSDGVISLPRTGQTTCYDESGAVIDCTNTGQDGDILAGIEWPSPRFRDNGNGTMTDNLTGLVWLKNADCGGEMTWQDALAYCNDLASGSCGLTDGSVAGDWRLPNIIELESLINAEESDPSVWLNNQGFSDVQSSFYWSSSTNPEDTFAAWIVTMNRGGVNQTNKLFLFSWYVWPVRAGHTGPAITWKTGQKNSYAAGDDGALQRGATWPSPRFDDNGNGTVTDLLTGLIWLKDADCSGEVTWEDALINCNNLESGSCGLSDGSVAGDWRLPNRKELLSLFDHSMYAPALPQNHPFPSMLLRCYWTSSTRAYNTSEAWMVHTAIGGVLDATKSDLYPFWPVRGGGR